VLEVGRLLFGSEREILDQENVFLALELLLEARGRGALEILDGPHASEHALRSCLADPRIDHHDAVVEGGYQRVRRAFVCGEASVHHATPQDHDLGPEPGTEEPSPLDRALERVVSSVMVPCAGKRMRPRMMGRFDAGTSS